MRRATVVVLLVVLSLFGAGSAVAASRQAATDQYGTTTVVGAGTVTTPVTTPTTPTTPDSGGTKDANGGGNGDGNGNGNGGTAGNGGNSGSTGGGQTSGAGSPAGPPANRVAVLNFGTPAKQLRKDVKDALAQAGLLPVKADLNKARFTAFLASPLARLLSPGGAGTAGQAFGAQLVNVTPLARSVFPALFGPSATFDPVIRAIVTRRAKLGGADRVKFLEGVTKGLLSTGVPFAYVERSDVKKSFVKRFKALHVLTVRDIDTPVGKQRLAQIMLGQVTTQAAIDAVKVSPASAVISSTDGQTGPAPWALLVVVLAGVGFAATGVVRHRGKTA